MRSQQHQLVLLSTPFLVALTGTSGRAASFDFNDHPSQEITQVIPSSSYIFPDGSELYVNLIEASVLSIPDNSTEFMKTLNADPKFQVGWKFAPALIERRLTGTFNIQRWKRLKLSRNPRLY